MCVRLCTAQANRSQQRGPFGSSSVRQSSDAGGICRGRHQRPARQLCCGASDAGTLHVRGAPIEHPGCAHQACQSAYTHMHNRACKGTCSVGALTATRVLPRYTSSSSASADVTYHPAGCEAPLLKNVYMEIQNNTLSLVYGRSGSGKTTLLQLLSGLRQQTEGSICMIKADGAALPCRLRRSPLHNTAASVCGAHPPL